MIKLKKVSLFGGFFLVALLFVGTLDHVDAIDRDTMDKEFRVYRELIRNMALEYRERMDRNTPMVEELREPLLGMPVPCDRGWIAGSSDARPWSGRCL